MLNRGRLNIDHKMRIVDTLTDAEPYVRHAEKKIVFSEVACTLSHLRTMQAAVSDNVGVALILEDDINVTTLPSRLNMSMFDLTQRAPPTWDILQLHMLNSEKYTELCRTAQEFVPWTPDFWSTGAYIITNYAMKRLLERTYVGGRWMLPSPVVADHFLYRSANTYTLARPTVRTYMMHTTTIQSRKAHEKLSDDENALWERLHDGCRVGATERSGRMPYVAITSAKVQDKWRQVRNSVALAKAAAFVVTCADRRCDEWKDFREAVGKNLGLRVILSNDEYFTRARFRSKMLALMDNLEQLPSRVEFDRVLFFDGDIDLSVLDVPSFLERSRGVIISQPLVDGPRPYAYAWGSQFFMPLNAQYWRTANPPQRFLQRCYVPWVEEQVFLIDARFLRWFFDTPKSRGITDAQYLYPTDWGHDMLWCSAAKVYNASSSSCAIIYHSRVLHANTRTIVKDGAYQFAGNYIHNMIKTHPWYKDPNEMQLNWTRSGFSSCE